jgi:hypothetical protein
MKNNRVEQIRVKILILDIKLMAMSRVRVPKNLKFRARGETPTRHI